jgi:SRSO17 transposase
LRRKAQRHWAPFYLKGLILPGERKSIEPMAARVAPADTRQLHHFVSTSPWATAPLEDELVQAADRLVGGSGAVLVVDDTTLVKQGRHSAGVKRQYCGQLGKRANGQVLVSLTLARAEVPVGIGLRLFLPEDWCADGARRTAVGVPEAISCRPKWRIALDEIDRVLGSGARFGCVLADAAYGKAAEFRAGLAERRLSYAVAILPTQKVYPAEVTLSHPVRKATGCAQGDWPPAPAPDPISCERGGGRAERGATGGVPHRLLAHRHERAAQGRVRCAPGAGGRWAGHITSPAPAG